MLLYRLFWIDSRYIEYIFSENKDFTTLTNEGKMDSTNNFNDVEFISDHCFSSNVESDKEGGSLQFKNYTKTEYEDFIKQATVEIMESDSLQISNETPVSQMQKMLGLENNDVNTSTKEDKLDSTDNLHHLKNSDFITDHCFPSDIESDQEGKYINLFCFFTSSGSN
ncbi:hypothetical protein NQ315_011006 [Exocentrus adspersus]|uniref:Uncharacterized protein n=1 Tax=Exocentrus adspersus TaxID=1586481 RepID=A0AAV8VJC5_9CUCU|nr:hypothetical protein NQ315_011006 [Exocentrus adspersus]